VGGLDGCVDGQQVGLLRDVGDLGRHLLQLGDEAAQALHLGVHRFVAGHRFLERIEDRLQLLAAVCERRHQALVAFLAGGAHGLVDPLDDAPETPRQGRDCRFHLLARARDVRCPDRQDVVTHTVRAVEEGGVRGGRT